MQVLLRNQENCFIKLIPTRFPGQTRPTLFMDPVELAAGQAVAEGALIAGPLEKRSDWVKSWNPRFCVLTTEQLAWHPGPGTSSERLSERLSDADAPVDKRRSSTKESMGSGGWRCVVMSSGVTVGASGGETLTLQPGDSKDMLHFRASTPAETESWHVQLSTLVEALQAEAKLARLHLRESASLFDARTFMEHPHIGSRNLRQRSLCVWPHSFHHTPAADSAAQLPLL